MLNSDRGRRYLGRIELDRGNSRLPHSVDIEVGTQNEKRQECNELCRASARDIPYAPDAVGSEARDALFNYYARTVRLMRQRPTFVCPTGSAAWSIRPDRGRRTGGAAGRSALP